MKEAIQKAIEGGYDGERSVVTIASTFDSENQPDFRVHSTDKAFLDPLFWQALGKACGWASKKPWDFVCNCMPEWREQNRKGGVTNDENHFMDCPQRLHYNLHMKMDWKYHWYRFIDWISEGKSPDDFFHDLLTN